MYLEFYNLKEKPFSLTPDPAFLYYSSVHKRAIAFLKYGLQESKGFLQLTGPVGSGKTTLLRAILAELDERAKTAYIMNPCAPFPDLLRSIMKDLEIPNIPQTRLKMELLDFFHDYLLIQMRKSNPVIVIFDEAQNLSLKNLEEIRMLSNFETTKGKLIQIALVGQPELAKIISMPELRQLKQRIQVRYNLTPLDPSDIKEYINHRLQVAGGDGGITFCSDACEKIYEFSGGIPRLINSVCDIALLIGYVSERKVFDAKVIEEAISELEGSFSDEPLEEPNDETIPAQGEASEEAMRSESGDGLPADDSASDPPRPPVSGKMDEQSHAPHDEATAVVPEVSVEKQPEDEKISPGASRNQGDPADASVDRDLSVGTGGGLPGTDYSLRAPEEQTESSITVATAVALETEDTHRPGLRQENDLSASATPQKPRGESLHSLLRHSGTRRFRVAGPGIAGTAKQKGSFLKILPRFLGKHRNGENGIGAPIGRMKDQKTDDGSVPNRTVQTAKYAPGDRGRIGKGPAFDTALEKPQVMKRKSAFPAPSKIFRRKRVPVTARAARGRPIGKRSHLQPGYLASPRLAVLFRDGKTAIGTTRNLSTKDVGFSFSPEKSRNDTREKFVAFAQIMALRFLDDRQATWERRYSADCHRPESRQILVTLLNGEVIEGVTPTRFDPKYRRFFVFSSDKDGGSSWSLIERHGTAGILAEDFAEGIYADKSLPMSEFAGLIRTDSGQLCAHEAAGDAFFSKGDFASALAEYDKAWGAATGLERLELKVSLAHFNQGIECIKRNDYLRAKSEFESVTANDRLLEITETKIGLVLRMLGAADMRRK